METQVIETAIEIPALVIEARGEIITSNFPAFAEMVRARLGEINRDLKTDEDFDQADADAKAIAGAESDLKAAKEKALADAEQLHALFSQIDDLSTELSKARIDLSKQIDQRKKQIKQDLIKEHLELLICASRHKSSYLQSLENATKAKRTVDSMRKSLDVVVKTHNALIAKSRAAIDTFVKAHGTEMVLDREDLEIKSPDVVEAELRRRFEAKRAEEQRKELEARAEDAKREAAALKAEAAVGVTSLVESKPSVLPDPTNVVSIDAGRSLRVNQVAEWAEFEQKVAAAFAPLREARNALKHPGNQRRAAAFAAACGEAWTKARAGKEVSGE